MVIWVANSVTYYPLNDTGRAIIVNFCDVAGASKNHLVGVSCLLHTIAEMNGSAYIEIRLGFCAA